MPKMRGKAQAEEKKVYVKTRLDKPAHDGLARYTDDNDLPSMSSAVMILLDIAKKCEKELGYKIDSGPTVTFKGG